MQMYPPGWRAMYPSSKMNMTCGARRRKRPHVAHLDRWAVGRHLMQLRRRVWCCNGADTTSSDLADDITRCSGKRYLFGKYYKSPSPSARKIVAVTVRPLARRAKLSYQPPCPLSLTSTYFSRLRPARGFLRRSPKQTFLDPQSACCNTSRIPSQPPALANGGTE
jgi:hypothetical protein